MKEDRWLVAIDEDENPIKHIYVLKQHNKSKYFGKSMHIINNTWNLECKQIKNDLGITQSLRCNYEKVEVNGFEGFKIIIIK